MEVIVTEQDGIAIVELAGRMDATTTCLLYTSRCV